MKSVVYWLMICATCVSGEVAIPEAPQASYQDVETDAVGCENCGQLSYGPARLGGVQTSYQTVEETVMVPQTVQRQVAVQTPMYVRDVYQTEKVGTEAVAVAAAAAVPAVPAVAAVPVRTRIGLQLVRKERPARLPLAVGNGSAGNTRRTPLRTVWGSVGRNLSAGYGSAGG